MTQRHLLWLVAALIGAAAAQPSPRGYVNAGPAVSRHAMVAVPGVGLVVFGGLPAGTQGFTNALGVYDPAVGAWQQR